MSVDIVAGQVWRYRDEREDRNVVVDSAEVEWSGDDQGFVFVHNEKTSRRSRMRAGVLRRYYRHLPDFPIGGAQ